MLAGSDMSHLCKGDRYCQDGGMPGNGEGSTNSMPALYNIGEIYRYDPITGQSNDFHLHNTSYLRLKNVQIGYNVPKKLIERWGISNLRLYVSGDNVLTITDFEDFDPERFSGRSTNSFPHVKTFVIGGNISF